MTLIYTEKNCYYMCIYNLFLTQPSIWRHPPPPSSSSLPPTQSFPLTPPLSLSLPNPLPCPAPPPPPLSFARANMQIRTEGLEREYQIKRLFPYNCKHREYHFGGHKTKKLSPTVQASHNSKFMWQCLLFHFHSPERKVMRFLQNSKILYNPRNMYGTFFSFIR